MKKRNYIKIWNAEETLYFHKEDLTNEDEICFVDAGYKIEIVFGSIRLNTYRNSINRLKELKCIND